MYKEYLDVIRDRPAWRRQQIAGMVYLWYNANDDGSTSSPLCPPMAFVVQKTTACVHFSLCEFYYIYIIALRQIDIAYVAWRRSTTAPTRNITEPLCKPKVDLWDFWVAIFLLSHSGV